MALGLLWSDSFNDGSIDPLWTTYEPFTSNINEAGGELVIRSETTHTTSWTDLVKNPVLARVQLSAIGAAPNAFYMLKTFFDMDSNVWTWRKHGMGIYEDLENFSAAVIGAGGSAANDPNTFKAENNVFSVGTPEAEIDNRPLTMVVFVNAHLTKSFSTKNGDTLGPGKIRSYYSDDGAEAVWKDIGPEDVLDASPDWAMLFVSVGQGSILGESTHDYFELWEDKGISIDSVTSPITTRGGDTMSVTGSFPALSTMRAYLGLNGDATDAPCFFGQGFGYEEGYSADGETVAIIAPPHAKTNAAILTIVVDGETVTSSAIDVVEHMYSDALYELRRYWPRDFNTGARSLLLEPEQD